MLKLTARNLRACCPIVALELAIVNICKCFQLRSPDHRSGVHRLDQRQGSAKDQPIPGLPGHDPPRWKKSPPRGQCSAGRDRTRTNARGCSVSLSAGSVGGPAFQRRGLPTPVGVWGERTHTPLVGVGRSLVGALEGRWKMAVRRLRFHWSCSTPNSVSLCSIAVIDAASIATRSRA